MSDADTTSLLMSALADRYPAEEWIRLYEVNEGTGARSGQRCDMMAICPWPSRGMELHGFEVKASRSDWLRELKKPSKAETFHQHCDRWWLVTPPDVVADGELPAGWGHLQLRKDGRLAVKTQADKIAGQPRRARPWMLHVTMLRAAATASVSEIAAARRQGFEEGRRHAESYGPDAQTAERLKRQEQTLQEQWKQLDYVLAEIGLTRADLTRGRRHGGVYLGAIDIADAARRLAAAERMLNDAPKTLRGLHERLGDLLDFIGTGADE